MDYRYHYILYSYILKYRSTKHQVYLVSWKWPFIAPPSIVSFITMYCHKEAKIRPRSAESPISQTCLECQARVSSRESRRPPCRCARAQRRRSPPPASRWRGSRLTGSPWSTARERRGTCTCRINRYLDLDIQCCCLRSRPIYLNVVRTCVSWLVS